MASIYDINGWDTSGSTAYVVDDIVSHNGISYYCTQAHGTKHEPSVTSTYWGGTNDYNGTEEPHFIWTPSYATNIQQKPNTISIQFGNGYEQRLQEGINNNLIALEVKYEARGEKETAAIVHFLTDKAGYKAFWFKATPPFGVLKRVVCKSWSTNQAFDDNFSTNATFTEVP
jgi:phage-related protein